MMLKLLQRFEQPIDEDDDLNEEQSDKDLKDKQKHMMKLKLKVLTKFNGT